MRKYNVLLASRCDAWASKGFEMHIRHQTFVCLVGSKQGTITRGD